MHQHYYIGTYTCLVSTLLSKPMASTSHSLPPSSDTAHCGTETHFLMPYIDDEKEMVQILYLPPAGSDVEVEVSVAGDQVKFIITLPSLSIKDVIPGGVREWLTSTNDPFAIVSHPLVVAMHKAFDTNQRMVRVYTVHLEEEVESAPSSITKEVLYLNQGGVSFQVICVTLQVMDGSDWKRV
jgi:hypothetical protein